MQWKEIDAIFDRTTVKNFNDNFKVLFDNQMTDEKILNTVMEKIDDSVIEKSVYNALPDIKSGIYDLTEDFIRNNSELFKSELGNKTNYLIVNGKDDFTAYLKLSENDFVGNRFYKDSSDEFLKGYENFIVSDEPKKEERIINKNYENVVGGSITSRVGNNHYTVVVGTKISFDFVGYEIAFSALCNGSGGLWRATVDGQTMGDYSVYSAAPITKKITVAEGLINTKHNLVLEFIGADPSNPIETPRGWIKYDANEVYTTFEVKGIDVITETHYPANFTVPFSNKEYALNVRDAEKTQATEWFPAHNGVITTFKGENFVKDLLVDGVKIDLTKQTGKIPFKQATFIQKVENKLTTDDGSRAEITFIVTFEDGKIHNDIKIKWLKDSEVTSGYVFQMPFNTEWFNSLITGNFEVLEKDITNTGTSSDITDLNTSKYVSVSNNIEGKNYTYSSTILKSTEPMKAIKLSHRDTTINKLYPQPYLYTTKNAGTIDHFVGYYEFSKMLNANQVYK